jgi:hypothetical protein
MSHNKIKVGGQEPDVNGGITVALNNLSDVSVTSPSNGVLLKYQSGWTFGNPGFVTTDYALLASNKTTGSVSDIYNTTTINSIVSDSRNSGYGQVETKGSANSYSGQYQSGTTSSGNAARYNGFTLPANSKFLLILTHVPIFNSSSGQTVLQWIDENDNTLGPQIQVKRDDRGSKKLYGYIETSGSTVEVFATCVDTNNHKRQNYADGDSWQAIRIG